MKPRDLGLFEELMDARSLFLTANSTTMYGLSEIDVKSGPVVVEVPPGVIGPVDDTCFRWGTDIGLTGPDQGQGGKFLIVHDTYKGKVSDGYFVGLTKHGNPGILNGEIMVCNKVYNQLVCHASCIGRNQFYGSIKPGRCEDSFTATNIASHDARNLQVSWYL